jgi:hypothetical protein
MRKKGSNQRLWNYLIKTKNRGKEKRRRERRGEKKERKSKTASEQIYERKITRKE